MVPLKAGFGFVVTWSHSRSPKSGSGVLPIILLQSLGLNVCVEGGKCGVGALNTCPSSQLYSFSTNPGQGMHPPWEGRCFWRGAGARRLVSAQGCWGPPSRGAF